MDEWIDLFMCRYVAGTQETAVTLAGLVLGLLCAQTIASNTQHAITLFAGLTCVHVWANYQAVYSLHVHSINPARAYLIAQEVMDIRRDVGNDLNAAHERLRSCVSLSVAEVSESQICVAYTIMYLILVT
jgi:hypothetical protein